MKLKLKEFVLENEQGKKVTVSFDESYSPEEMVEVLEKLQDKTSSHKERSQAESNVNPDFNGDYESLTIKEKLKLIVKEIKHGWFTSDHIRELYHYNYHEEIKPSTVSTYLARLYDEEYLERRGSRARREYCLTETQITPIECIREI